MSARLARVARASLVPVLVLIAWRLACQWKLVNPLLVAPPELVLRRALGIVRTGELFEQLSASVQRDLLGFLIGTLAGIVVGGSMGAFESFERLVGPTIHAFKQVAIFAWIPLMSVWFGTGELAKVVFIALSAFFPVVLNTYEGVRGVPVQLVEVARVFRFTPWQITRRLLLPAAAPSIFAGVQLALVYAWLGTIGAEYLLAAGPGVGNLMIEGRESFAMDKVLLGVILVGAVGAALNGLAAVVEQRALRWRVRGV